MRNRSHDPSHHEQTFLPQSYILLLFDLTAAWPSDISIQLYVHRSTLRDWSNDPSHHERSFLPQSYISLLFDLNAAWPSDISIQLYVHRSTIMDWSDDPSHPENTIYHRATSHSLNCIILPIFIPFNTKYSNGYQWYSIPIKLNKKCSHLIAPCKWHVRYLQNCWPNLDHIDVGGVCKYLYLFMLTSMHVYFMGVCIS